MRTLLFTLLVIALFTSSCSNNNKNDWQKHNLNGKVKSFKVVSYEAIEQFGEIKKSTRKAYYVPGYYDLIDEQEVFNMKGNIIESSFTDLKWTLKYDNKGNNIESNMYNSDGKLLNKSKYKYDDKGNNIESNSYNPNGKLDGRTTHNYDKKGKLIESNSYYPIGILSSKTLYQYDDKENLIEEKLYDTISVCVNKNVFQYDDNGNQIELNNYMPEGALFNRKISKYDDKRNVIEINSYFPHDTVHNTYKYEFDKNGNWIFKIIFINEIPKYIQERKIEYFD